MFTELYSFFFDWLFGGVYPDFLSAQGAEFATIICCLIVIVAVIAIALIPIKAIVNSICRW